MLVTSTVRIPTGTARLECFGSARKIAWFEPSNPGILIVLYPRADEPTSSTIRPISTFAPSTESVFKATVREKGAQEAPDLWLVLDEDNKGLGGAAAFRLGGGPAPDLSHRQAEARVARCRSAA
jgi:hypothetical protein